jgi:hypothetical protein
MGKKFLVSKKVYTFVENKSIYRKYKDHNNEIK